LINARKTELDVVSLVRLAPRASLSLDAHEHVAFFLLNPLQQEGRKSTELIQIGE
jgi:hypothetical protein